MENITELNEISAPRGKHRNGASAAVSLGPRDELKGTLVVDGDIHIEGSVEGDVTASKKLSVHGSGSLNGDVRTPRLRVDDGTVVNGTITMRPEGSE
jgi:cytoskeletal protein CcmA (bactofilin family)